SFYPFAEFSPEWQALLWASEKNTPARFFDLPCTHSFALRSDEEKTAEPSIDPFGYFAQADGYHDGEHWWNDQIEERESSPNFFQAILEAVTALRTELNHPESALTLKREAWMRREMRKAAKEGFENIAVVCGAWHAPALVDLPPATHDNALLKNLAKVKIGGTWSPWTNERLTSASGYGAGVSAPGWYHHLWKNEPNSTTRWITKAARILRKEDLEGSSASIIEAVRLSETLAGLRGRPRPGLPETLEAMQSIFCQGEGLSLDLLKKPLLISERLGELPPGISRLPIQEDLEKHQRRLRLKPTAGEKPIILDLRENAHREKSALLHRLLVLDINWGRKTHSRGKGTFKEAWALRWQPEFAVSLIDAAAFGNTIESAASRKLSKTTDLSLGELTEHIDLALLSDLPLAVDHLLHELQQVAATSHDTLQLLKALPPLCRIARYGDVRGTRLDSVTTILQELALRTRIELPGHCSGLDDEAASDTSNLIREYTNALGSLDDDDLIQGLFESLLKIADHELAHPEIKGTVTRLLRDRGQLDTEQTATFLSLALSTGNLPKDSALWAQGFLTHGGAILVHDPELLGLFHTWITSLTDETFKDTLPLLRRTFGQFSTPEKQQISHQIANPTSSKNTPSSTNLDTERARLAVALVAKLYQLPLSHKPS
ncbi:MAG: hypothetical protein ACJAVK_002678, partial [Akkermansiaceae bacterium]